MAKVKFAADIESISGKLCKNGGVVYSVNSRTGKTHRSERHQYEDKNSAKQQGVRNTFKTRSQAAKTWWASNKPLVDSETGTVTREATEDYNKVLKLYKAQNKIGNIYSFFCTFVQDDGTVTIGTKRVKGGVSDSSTSGTPTTPTTNPNDRGDGI